MTFARFADLMEKIGFRENEQVTPVFELNQKDIEFFVLKNSYLKTAGTYRVINIWSHRGGVAFWAKKDGSGDKLFPFFPEDVDSLAEKMKFKKN